jgi:hypothetical protein
MGRSRRAGLLATQGIRGGANRRVLERIAESGGIFFARSDDPWVLSGANVHISFIGQDDGSETERQLDGRSVVSVNANLTSGVDLTRARRLSENRDIAFVGDQKGGPFDVYEQVATAMLAWPNPDGRSNADVLAPWLNGEDLTRRPRHMWVIDFGLSATIDEAALYEAPFEHVRRYVQPTRVGVRNRHRADKWWLHEAPAGRMRSRLSGLPRFIVTPTTAKHRLFTWAPVGTLPSIAVVAIASAEEWVFGVLQSSVHRIWSRAVSTQLREAESATRYLPQSSFETFPFPRPSDDQREAIAAAARELVRLRDGWLNPPGLDPAELSKRTLTNLYNARPTWLEHAHAALDRAVLAAYGWPDDLAGEPLLAALLALNLERDPA